MKKLKRRKRRGVTRIRRVMVKKGLKKRRPVNQTALHEAYNRAYDQGFDEAYNEGYNVGYAEGLAKGSQEIRET